MVYNLIQSLKPACSERPCVHVEEPFSMSMNNVVFHDSIDETDVAVANYMRVRMPITC